MTTGNSTSLSRKQREILQRNQLILDAACNIMRESGYAGLNMERVAQKIEYAKGTVYQHYKNKEEILAAIVVRNLEKMVDLFDRAVSYPGRNREKMLAVMVAYELYIRLNPQEFADFQTLKNVAIREKLCDDSINRIHQLEHHGIECSAAVVREALEQGELNLREVSPEQFVFGFWALAFGSASLEFSDIPLDKLGISAPLETAHIHGRHMLDGYNWQPLSTDWDYDASRQDILNRVFADELAQLQSQTGVLT